MQLIGHTKSRNSLTLLVPVQCMLTLTRLSVQSVTHSLTDQIVLTDENRLMRLNTICHTTLEETDSVNREEHV